MAPASPHRSTSGAMSRLGVIACLVILVVAVGCREASAPPSAPESITFEIDGSGVQYFYRDSHTGTLSAKTVASIPVEHRGAVRIYDHESLADAPPKQADERIVYVADLFGARPGDERRARRMTREAYSARALAAELAHRQGVYVELVAREMGKMADESVRADKAEKARHIFKEMLPERSEARRRLERHERARKRAESILRDERNSDE